MVGSHTIQKLGSSKSLGSYSLLDVDTPAGLSRDVTCYDIEFKGIFYICKKASKDVVIQVRGNDGLNQGESNGSEKSGQVPGIL